MASEGPETVEAGAGCPGEYGGVRGAPRRALDLSILRTIRHELSELATVLTSTPLHAVLPDEELDSKAPKRTPVVLVHGLFGAPTNFAVLRRFLLTCGIGHFAAFRYRPRLHYPRLVVRLAEFIEDVCRTTGAPQVDVVGHSLGGLIARGVMASGHAARVRRLITLGAPSLGPAKAPQELAVYGAADPIIPVPDTVHGTRDRVLVVPGCGHLGLLDHPAVLHAVATFLGAPVEAISDAAQALPPRPARGRSRRGPSRGSTTAPARTLAHA